MCVCRDDTWNTFTDLLLASADRRPVDPPPIVELHIFEGENAEKEITFQSNANYFLFASLEPCRQIAQGRVATESNQSLALTGTPVAGMVYLDRPTSAGYFVFPDLSVRNEGVFRIAFGLFEDLKDDQDSEPSTDSDAESEHVTHRCEVQSAPFVVWSAKKFPGLGTSTHLSRVVAEQGCRVRIQRDVRLRKREKKDEYDDVAPDSYGYQRKDVTPSQSRGSYEPRSSIGDAFSMTNVATDTGLSSMTSDTGMPLGGRNSMILSNRLCPPTTDEGRSHPRNLQNSNTSLAYTTMPESQHQHHAFGVADAGFPQQTYRPKTQLPGQTLPLSALPQQPRALSSYYTNNDATTYRPNMYPQSQPWPDFRNRYGSSSLLECKLEPDPDIFGDRRRTIESGNLNSADPNDRRPLPPPLANQPPVLPNLPRLDTSFAAPRTSQSDISATNRMSLPSLLPLPTDRYNATNSILPLPMQTTAGPSTPSCHAFQLPVGKRTFQSSFDSQHLQTMLHHGARPDTDTMRDNVDSDDDFRPHLRYRRADGRETVRTIAPSFDCL